MPAIPIPFVVALLLAVLLAQLIARREPAGRPTIAFVIACLVLVVIVGLRWSLNSPFTRFLQPVAASALPPIAWLCFARLRDATVRRPWLHFAPAAVVLVLSALTPYWRMPLDAVIALLFFGYGAALLRLGWQGADGLEQARLSEAESARNATLWAGALLCFSGAIDALIAADFALNQGQHIPVIVGIANIFELPMIAYAVIVGGNAAAPEKVDATTDGLPEPGAPPTDDDGTIVAAVDRLMRDKRLFRDPDLTLQRLARCAVIPARDISRAINRTFGRNVSQVVNEYRVEEAKRLLATDLPVTSVMFECGFQTKSNFNREFRRVTGVSPSDYRRNLAGNAEARKSVTSFSTSP